MGQMEIERKFVLGRVPDDMIAGCRGEQIRQGYLLHDENSELRIRQRDDHYWMTVKQGTGLSRFEQECEIPETQFNMLWPLTEGRRIEKTRYSVPVGEHLFEIDLFSGALSRLIVLEIEFPDVETSQLFTQPDFIAREVTEDRSYKNAVLAHRGLPESFLQWIKDH